MKTDEKAQRVQAATLGFQGLARVPGTPVAYKLRGKQAVDAEGVPIGETVAGSKAASTLSALSGEEDQDLMASVAGVPAHGSCEPATDTQHSAGKEG